MSLVKFKVKIKQNWYCLTRFLHEHNSIITRLIAKLIIIHVTLLIFFCVYSSLVALGLIGQRSERVHCYGKPT